MTDEDNTNTSMDALANRLTTDIATAIVTSRMVAMGEIGKTIKDVRHQVMTGLSLEKGHTSDSPRPEPAVPIEESIKPTHLICLEDGKALKMLKRHLKSSYDMSPEQYRARWNLPSDYPMVAPDYSTQRSQLAIKSGLGNSPRSKKAAAVKE
jgi:predicted transcriptional regulator